MLSMAALTSASVLADFTVCIPARWAFTLISAALTNSLMASSSWIRRKVTIALASSKSIPWGGLSGSIHYQLIVTAESM
ncbi:hypothetical protein RINTHM_10550 [Richelia intracellularis HM01]|nr:hypothetical protein RINTHM_10550 [Richelia intracellularis HM01]